MKKFSVIIIPVIILCIFLYNAFLAYPEASNISHEDEYYYNEDISEDGTPMANDSMSLSTSAAHPAVLDLTKDSLEVLVNKEYSLPSDYVPEDLVVPDVLFNINYYDEKKLMRQEAATALEALFQDASDEGLTFYGISAYRSYARQEQIYNTNIQTKGEEYTNRYSARPGYSEHQTGLVIDVSSAAISNRLEPVFAYTPEGKWLAENAYKYGFTIRYPKDKEEITGYSYEPWHIRYVGKKLAQYLHDHELTLEEYYGYVPSEPQDDELSYDSVTDVDSSTDKKEMTEPTKKEIEEVSEKKSSDETSSKQPDSKDTESDSDTNKKLPDDSTVDKPPVTSDGSEKKPPVTPDSTGKKPSAAPDDAGKKPSDTPDGTGKKPSTTPDDTEKKPSDTPGGAMNEPADNTGDTPPHTSDDTENTPAETPVDTGNTSTGTPDSAGTQSPVTPDDTHSSLPSTPGTSGEQSGTNLN